MDMPKVQRFHAWEYTGDHNNGQWSKSKLSHADIELVRAADYDALAAKLAEVEAELKDAEEWQGYWRGQSMKNRSRAEAAEARIAHLENHIEAVAKDTHKIMVDLDDPRVVALAEAAQAVVDRWDSPQWKDLRHTGTHINELRDALSALEENK